MAVDRKSGTYTKPWVSPNNTFRHSFRKSFPFPPGTCRCSRNRKVGIYHVGVFLVGWRDISGSAIPTLRFSLLSLADLGG